MNGELRTDDIYACLFDDEAFARLPDLLASAGGARSGIVHWRAGDCDYEVLGCSYFPAGVIAQLPELLVFDPWTRVGMKHPNRLMRLDQFVANWEASIPYNEIIRPAGDDTTQCMGITVTLPQGYGSLAVHRARSQPPFDADDEAKFAAVLDDFKRVLRLRVRLMAERQSTKLDKQTLDALGSPIVVVAADGRVLRTNAAAERSLTRVQGLRQAGGRLVADDSRSAARLERAISLATAPAQPKAGAVMVERGDGLAPYALTIAPLPSETKGRCAMILYLDPDAEDATLIDRLRALFDLTPAEARIAADLGLGYSALQIAARRGVRPNTLKTQLRLIAAKTGRSRQSEIASLVAALPPLSTPNWFAAPAPVRARDPALLRPDDPGDPVRGVGLPEPDLEGDLGVEEL